MTEVETAGLELADPERALAVAYAPAAARPALAALFALDERLGAIVAQTTEPTIGLIRLAWWREALERLDHAPPPPEPLLQALAREVLPRGITGSALARLEAGWAALFDTPLAADSVGEFGVHRGETLFMLAGRLLGSDDARLSRAGEGWALADLAHRHSSADVREWARRQGRQALDVLTVGRWSRPARPLAALAALARIDLTRPGSRRQGAPGRLARMLAMRLFGR